MELTVFTGSQVHTDSVSECDSLKDVRGELEDWKNKKGQKGKKDKPYIAD